MVNHLTETLLLLDMCNLFAIHFTYISQRLEEVIGCRGVVLIRQQMVLKRFVI